MKEFFLAVFDSTHHALKFEKVMKDNNININIIPVPREITANCGLAVMFSGEDNHNVRQTAAANELIIKGYYNVLQKDNKKEYIHSI